MSGPDETREPEPLVLAFAQLYLEVECGRRPRATVEPLLSPRLAAKLAPAWVRGGPLRRPVAVRGFAPAPDAFEAAVVVRSGRWHGALAVRMERRGRGWRVTEVSRPEDGPLPEPVVYLPGAEPCAFDLVCPSPEDERAARRLELVAGLTVAATGSGAPESPVLVGLGAPGRVA